MSKKIVSKNKHFKQILILALVVIGLAAGVILVTKSSSLLFAPKAYSYYTNGDSKCVDSTHVAIYSYRQWQTYSCYTKCSNGFCAGCTSGQTKCADSTHVVKCIGAGVENPRNGTVNTTYCQYGCMNGQCKTSPRATVKPTSTPKPACAAPNTCKSTCPAGHNQTGSCNSGYCCSP